MNGLDDLPSIAPRKYKTEAAVPYERDKDTWEAEGASGAVYRYTVRNNGEPVAVKRIRYSGVNSAEKKAQWQGTVEREISLLKMCSHRNLAEFVAAYNIETHPDCYYIVMKPWAPVTLKALVLSVDHNRKSTKVSWWNDMSIIDKCQLAFEGLIEGLLYLHEHLIFHKDIKPENILFHELTPTPVITDFGVSKLYKRKAPTNFTDSTLDFLAPEQIKHEESSPLSDIFALGCCFLWYFMAANGGCDLLYKLFNLVQEMPFQYGRELAHIYPFLREYLAKQRSNPSTISCLGFLIREMLLCDPNKRPTAPKVKKLLENIRHERLTSSFKVDYQSSNLTLAQILGKQEIFDDLGLPLIGAQVSDHPIEPIVFRYRAYYLGPAHTENEISPMISLDTGSEINLISAELIDELREAGYEISPSLRQPTVSVATLGGTIEAPQVCLRICIGAYNGRNTRPVIMRAEFAVLRGFDTYFRALLGRLSIIRLQEAMKEPPST